MKRSKIMPRLTLLLMLLLMLLLLFEVVALHLNRRPLEMVVREIREDAAERPYFPRLVCELRNDRITPIRYFAVNDHFPAYETVRDGRASVQMWCTATDDHWLAPFSSVRLEIPVPEGGFQDCRISVLCEGTSLLSWLLWPSADFEKASVWGRDGKMTRRD